jgi:hypothetical protein
MVERELVHLAPRVADPDRGGDQEQHEPRDHHDQRDRDPDDRDRDADRVEDREDARVRQVDLLARGGHIRDVVALGHQVV